MQIKPFVFTALILLCVAIAPAEDAKKESLDGLWMPLTAEMGGTQFPDEVRKTIKLALQGDKYAVTLGKAVDQGTLKFNPAASPKTIAITGTDGANKGKTILAIYERNGDKLRICYDLTGKSYPTEFKSAAGTPLFLVEYELQKP